MPLKNKINLQSTSDLAQVGIQSNSSINSTTIRSSTSVTSGIEVFTVADATNKIGIQSNVGIKDPIQVNFTGDVLSYEEALDILEPFGITDTSFIVSGSSTINRNTLELGVSAEINDTKIII